MADRPVSLRNPKSIRPWQHVLEPLAGYLHLAERMLAEKDARLLRRSPELTRFC
jgi:CDP-glucose 4,6-dehydratase